MTIDVQKMTTRIEKDLDHLAQFTATPGHGCTRLPFTTEARQVAEYLKICMKNGGLDVHEDEAGNVFGVVHGENPDLPVIMMGSHYDSVINGGNFDGIAGVVCAMELAKYMVETGVKLKRDFVVVAFCAEEGMRFGTGYFGSKCMLGQMTVEDCRHFKDKDGISVYDAMKADNLVPEDIYKAKWDLNKIGHFIEPHIEQGPVLDAKKLEIGLVECIVGIQRYMIKVNGRSDHAGTTPMDMRKDAVDVATKVISKIADWAREKGDGTVATTGYMKVIPGGMNVVAESAEFSIDIRSRHNDYIDDIAAKIRAELDQQCALWNMSYDIDTKLVITPVSLSTKMLEIMDESCREKGYSHMCLISGAGHDALAIGQVLDTVMVFVPSKDGRSHCPVEWTDYSYFGKAVDVISDLVMKLQ